MSVTGYGFTLSDSLGYRNATWAGDVDLGVICFSTERYCTHPPGDIWKCIRGYLEMTEGKS